MDFWIDFGISAAITLLRKLTTNREQAGAWRKTFLKIQTLIWGVYGEDTAFRAVVGVPPINDPNETSANV